MKKLAIMFAAALLVAGCGGGKDGAARGNPSNNTSVCAYTKRVGSRGRVYVQMAATPRSLEPTACSAFNASFGDEGFRWSAGWGRATCTAAGTRTGRRTRSSSACSRPAARLDSRSAARSTPATASSATGDLEAERKHGRCGLRSHGPVIHASALQEVEGARRLEHR